jgi:polar amino acid transport system substrate-binding protein
MLVGGLLIGLSGTAAPASADCPKPLTWAWNSYEPYSYKNSNQILVGLDVELVHEIMKQAKCDYRLSEIPAKRAMKMLEAGEVDLMTAASVTPERQAFGYFTEPYRSERIVMFALRDSPATGLTGLAQVLARRLRVAAGLGGYYGKDYQALQEQFRHEGLLELNNSLEQRVTMLALGRVDVLIEDEVAGIATARKLRYDDRLQIVGEPLNEAPVSLLLSKISVPKETVAAIDAAIRALQTSPTYQRIMKAHTEFGYQ